MQHATGEHANRRAWERYAREEALTALNLECSTCMEMVHCEWEGGEKAARYNRGCGATSSTNRRKSKSVRVTDNDTVITPTTYISWSIYSSAPGARLIRLSSVSPSNPAMSDAGKKSRRKIGTFARMTCPPSMSIPNRAIAAVCSGERR